MMPAIWFINFITQISVIVGVEIMADPNADLSDGLVGIVFVNIIIVKRNCLIITGIFLNDFKVRVSPVILSKQSKKENI